MAYKLQPLDPERYKDVVVVSSKDWFEGFRNIPFSFNMFLVEIEDFTSREGEFNLLDPDVVVVKDVSRSDKSIMDTKRICEAIRSQSLCKIIFVYGRDSSVGSDYSAFSDVSVSNPQTYEDRLNLVLEITRIAYNAQTSLEIREKFGPKEEFKWLLTVGISASALSGAFIWMMQGDPVLAAKTSLAALSAITGLRIGALIRKLLRLK